jgi:hypothetical protein
MLQFPAPSAVSVACATLSIVWAQTYTTVDFPGATATTLNSGPSPQGVSVGTETTACVTHGFSLTAASVFTVFDPPGSTLTIPNFITPEGMIEGQFDDASDVQHGFVLY